MTSVTTNVTASMAKASSTSPTIVSTLATRQQMLLDRGTEPQPVVGGLGDEAHRGTRGGQHRSEVDPPVAGVEGREALRERDRQQEGEQHLDAGQRHPQLVEQLDQLAVGVLVAVLPRAGLGLTRHRPSRRVNHWCLQGYPREAGSNRGVQVSASLDDAQDLGRDEVGVGERHVVGGAVGRDVPALRGGRGLRSVRGDQRRPTRCGRAGWTWCRR